MVVERSGGILKIKVTVTRKLVEQTDLVVEIDPISDPCPFDMTWKDNVAEQIEDDPDLDQLLEGKHWDLVEVDNSFPRIAPSSVEVVE